MVGIDPGQARLFDAEVLTERLGLLLERVVPGRLAEIAFEMAMPPPYTVSIVWFT